MISLCGTDDFNEIYETINDGTSAYRGVIPADRWHEPYMTKEETEKLLRKYWSIPERQIETSIVLASSDWKSIV